MFETLLAAFVLLFVVVDPIGVAAIYAALVHGARGLTSGASPATGCCWPRGSC